MRLLLGVGALFLMEALAASAAAPDPGSDRPSVTLVAAH